MKCNTWVELDLGILRENMRLLKNAVGDGVEIMPVVKAEAYGHGMVEVAACAAQCGARWFAVSHLHEGQRLRQALPEARILLLGVIMPDEVAEAMAGNLVPVVVDEDHGRALAAAAARAGGKLKCHVKVDTGMGRLGIHWDVAAAAIASLAETRRLDVTGLCSHLSSSDAPERALSDAQIERFNAVLSRCSETGMSIPFRHMSNSGGALLGPNAAYDAVRPGIIMYGYGRKESTVKAATRPFLQWKTRVVQVKSIAAGQPVGYDGTYITRGATNIAILDAGYADGYSRLLSNRGFAIAGGVRVPVVGRVSMNFIALDLGPRTSVKAGDEAVLIGSQGAEAIWADELAHLCHTIPYEILTSIRTDLRIARG